MIFYTDRTHYYETNVWPENIKTFHSHILFNWILFQYTYYIRIHIIYILFIHKAKINFLKNREFSLFFVWSVLLLLCFDQKIFTINKNRLLNFHWNGFSLFIASNKKENKKNFVCWLTDNIDHDLSIRKLDAYWKQRFIEFRWFQLIVWFIII